jgi:hypothetical protein
MRRVTRLLSVAALGAALTLPAAAQTGASAQVIQGPEVEQFLKRARFTARQPLGAGVSGSLKVTLEQDRKTEFAVLKTIDQKRPGAQLNAKGEIEIDFQDSWRTEVAAYELDKLLGLGMVPATIERRSPYEDKPASLQLWVVSSMTEAKRRQNAVIPPDSERWSRQLIAMNVFDALIYNTDRHPDNLLMTENFEVRLIDHSRSFRPNAELRNRDDLQRFPRKMIEKLEQLTKADVEKRLGDYLSLTQIDGLMKRRQLLLDLVHQRTVEHGERAVLYP